MTPEARAARERKQKIFVVVGGLFLVALLAFQVPKILGGSSSSSAAPTTTATDAESAAAGAAATLVSPEVVAVVHTPAASGKLDSLSVFSAKDPFVQQVTPATAADSQAPASEGGAAVEKANGETPAQEFTTGATSGSAVTIVTVNGARQVVSPGQKFPASDPMFVLVAEKPGAKSVVVGVAGGAYAGGAKTTTLKVGKTLTLVNTATGASYKLRLVSVGSGDEAEPTAKP